MKIGCGLGALCETKQHCTRGAETEVICWNDVDEVKPDKGSHIWYISKKMAELQYESKVWSWAYEGDVCYGDYLESNLVEWDSDSAPEEFKYWVYFPKFK